MSGNGHPRESLRAEAARRQVSVYRVRVDRAAGRGVSPRAAVGHARAGETPLSQRPRRTVQIGDRELKIRHGGHDANRAYQLIKDIHDLLSGDLSPESFDRKWAGKKLGGEGLPSAADLILEAESAELDPGKLGTP